jgi:nucleotide-binding universal stress UspA family protein
MKPAPLLAGIDFSAASPAVLRHAAHFAALNGATVVAAHVIDASRLDHRASGGRANPPDDVLAAAARQKLEHLATTEAAGQPVRLEVRIGKPADELQHLAASSGAGLLVIAANDLTKSRLGSVASRCVRSAPCDVLVLRDWQEGNFARIALCTDFSAVSERALERAVSLAADHAAVLDIVHVIYPPSRDVWGEVLEHGMDSPQSYEEECRAEIDRRMDHFLAPQAERLAAVRHQRTLLESVSPSMALTHHVRDSGADLVVLGTRRMSTVAGWLVGTNAERLLHDAPVSVLAVRSA